MLHLFGKVYLSLDTTIDLDYNRFVISKKFGLPLDSILEKLHPNKLIGTGKSFNELVGTDKKYKTYAELIQACILISETNQKVILYCDKESFLHFICLWCKSAFKQIDCESSFKIVQAYFLKIVLLSETTTRGARGTAIYYAANLPTREEFESVFNSTVENITLTYIINTVSNQKSVEFLLSSYLYNKSYKQELKNRIRILIARHVEEKIKEAWRNIIQNSLKIPIQNEFGFNYTLDNLGEIIFDPKIKILTDLNSWRTIYSRFDTKPELDLTIFSDEEILKLKNLIKHVGIVCDIPEYNIIWKRTFTYIDILRYQELSDQNLEEIIDLEIFSANTTAEDLDSFWGSKDDENVNIFLIDYIIQEKILENFSVLEKYVLK